MRLKILIGSLVFAMVTGACGTAAPVLSSGPTLPFATSPTATEAGSMQPAGGDSGQATSNPVVVEPSLGTEEGYPFALSADSPRYLPAFTQPDAGCAWVGVAGQVFDQQGAPVEGVVVLVKGYFDNQLIDVQTLSGLQQAYGQSGFEVQIGDLAADTSNALTVQLVNSKFEALSEAYPLTTYNDCQRNLILVTFQARSDSWRNYLP